MGYNGEQPVDFLINWAQPALQIFGFVDTKSFRYKSFRYTPKSVRYKDEFDSIQPQSK